jgi:hypothetical protein
MTDRVQLETDAPPTIGKERGLSGGTNPSSPHGFLNEGKQRLITISGANKDIGKSSLAAYLAAHCRDCAGIKISMHSESSDDEGLIAEDDSSSRLETDTARIYRAGARPVYWLRTTKEQLLQDLLTAMNEIAAPVVIIEGNSLLEHLQPDYAIFIMGPGFEDFKPSAHFALGKADTVIVNGESEIAGGQLLELERKIKELNPKAKMIVVSETGKDRAWEMVLSRVSGRLGGDHMSAEVNEKVLEAVKAKSRDGRISCAVALKLAAELGVPPQEVGKAANALEIKIANCSLGCF